MKIYHYLTLIFTLLGIGLLAPQAKGDAVRETYEADNMVERPLTAQTVYITTSKDVYGESCYPTTPTGNQFNLYLGYDTWYGKCRTRPFLKFDLSSLPAGATIDSARLEIYQYAVEAGSSYGITAYPITQSWDEYAMTWNNQPSVGSSTASATFSTGLGWKYVTLTTLTRQWYNGSTTNRGVALRANSEYSSGGIFYARNCSSAQCPGGQRPRLKVVYTPAPSTFSVSGEVIDGNGLPLSGVSMSNGSATVTTNANGDYTFTTLNAGTYTITPSKSGYSTCTPTSRSVSGPPNQSGKDFVCEADPVYSIAGTVVDNNGFPLSGVLISDGNGHTATTAANGSYTIPNLLPNSYNLTATKTGYAFSPASRSVTISTANVNNQNFSGTEVYAISGSIRDTNNNPISGMSVVILGPQSSTVTSNGSGNYTANTLNPGRYYVKASSGGAYVLSPKMRITTLPPSSINQNFTVIPQYGTLTGRITVQGSGQAIAGAKVSAGGVKGKTNSSGYYTLNDILPGRHTMRVSASNYKNYKGEVTITANASKTRNVQLKTIQPDGYRLPFPAGARYHVNQGNDGPNRYWSHWWGYKARYAYDFGGWVAGKRVIEGKNVVASREGKVIDIVKNFSKSCYNPTTQSCSNACLNSANYVRIAHKDGTSSLYLHLQKNSVPISKNQYVSSGQVIGKAGNTGCSSGAHLHFQRNDSNWGWQSVKTPFLDVTTNGGIPQWYQWYTSGNNLVSALTASAQADTEAPTGQVEFRLTGQVTHKVQIDGFDYDSNTLEMRMAASESDLSTEPWQPFTYTKTVDWTAYEAYVELKDASGNTAIYSDTIEAVAFETIVPSFDIASQICVGQAIDLQNNTTPFCEQCGWHWTMGNGSSSNVAEPQFEYIGEYPVFSYDTSGDYTMTLSVTNADTSSSISKQVEALPVSSSAFTVTRSADTVTVEAHEVNAASWQWDFGDGFSTTGRTASHTYASAELAEQASIELTVEAHNGCVTSGHQVAVIIADPTTIYLPFIIK